MTDSQSNPQQNSGPPAPRRSSAADWAFLVPVFALQLALFCFLVFHRLVDSDEGFYLYISKLIFTEGTVPYRDVFYQQMPLLPYCYGAWMKVFGFGWESGRSLSAVLAALIGTLIFLHVRRATGRFLFAFAALLLYAMNLSVLLFFLTAKTYALSTALLFGGLLAAANAGNEEKAWMAGLGGFLCALSVQTRLFFAFAALVPIVWFWLRRKNDSGKTAFRMFLAGFALGFVPTLIFLLLAPEQFIYDNILYHGMRDPAGLIGDLEQKLHVAGKLVLGPEYSRPTLFAFLLWGIPITAAMWKRASDFAKLSLIGLLVLGASSFLPTPTFGQYFCVLVPFLVVCLTEGFSHALGRVPALWARRISTAGFFVFALVLAAGGMFRIPNLFFWGEGMPGISRGSEPDDWRLTTVKEVASVIESHADKGSPVVSSWPGYFVGIDRRVYPKMENQISVDTSSKLTVKEADRYRMLREEELVQAIADPSVRMVVAGNCTHERRPLYREAAHESGYSPLPPVGNAEIFVRPSDAESADE